MYSYQWLHIPKPTAYSFCVFLFTKMCDCIRNLFVFQVNESNLYFIIFNYIYHYFKILWTIKKCTVLPITLYKMSQWQSSHNL